MKTFISVIAAILFSAASVFAQQSGGGGSGLPSTGTANQCLLSTGSGSGSVWGSCSGSSSTNWSSIVPGTGSITAGTYTFPTGTTETFSGTGTINANQINGTALSSLSTGIIKNTTTTGVPSIAASADVIALFSGTCSVSTYLRGDGACAAALTGATASGGLLVTGTTIGLLTSCSTNQVLQWSGTAWVCATISGGGGANTALSNLASVAVNTPLTVASAGASGIGTKTTPFGEGNFTQVTNGDSVIFGSFTSLTNTGLLLELFGAPSQPADVFTVDSLGNEVNAGSDSVGTSLLVGTTGTFGSVVQVGAAGSLNTACPSTVTGIWCATEGSTAATPTATVDYIRADSGTHKLLYSVNGSAEATLATGGTVTSVATTAPITGGTITGTGTIACATCATTTNGGALTATSPATISAAGVIACATCVTSSGGGAMTATSPVTVSAAGLIAISGVTSEQGNGAKLQLSTGTTTTNDCVKFDANGNTVDAGAACGSGGGSGTVSANNGTAGALANYTAAGGSTTVSADQAIIDNGTTITASEPFIDSANGAASQGSLTLTGTIFTGGTATTNTPLFYYNCSGATAPTTWSANGTIVGFNPCTGFTGNVIDVHAVNGGASVASVGAGGAVVGTSMRSSLFENSTNNTASTFQGGIDASANSALGGGWFRGANNSNAGSSAVGGNSMLSAGQDTGSTTGSQGVVAVSSSYNTGTTVTQWNLQCSQTTGQTTQDCGASPTNIIGSALNKGTSSTRVIIAGETGINASAAVTIGHTVCAGSTAGQVTDSGGTGACANNQATVGFVKATSGIWTFPDATSFTATTTLPLVSLYALNPVPSAGAGVAVTNTTSVTQSNPTAATDVQLMELSLSANYLNTVGQPFVIHGSGVLTTTAASTPQVTITAKICSVSGCGSGTVTPLAAIQSAALNTVAITNASWNYQITATTVGNGSSCNLIVKGSPGLTIENGASLATADSVYADSNTAVSSPNQTCTNALFLDFFVQQSATGASNSYKQLLGAIMPQGGGPVTSVDGLSGAVTSITQTIANGTAALGTSAISSGTCATVVTVSATGVATTDNIMADFNADPTSTTGYSPSSSGMLSVIKYPTANNVNFKICNNTSSSITPGAVTLNWRVVR